MWKLALLSFVLAFVTPNLGMSDNLSQVEAAKPKLNKKKATIKENKTLILKVSTPAARVRWTSSNKKVVKITKTTGSKKQKAVIKGEKSGKAVITAKIGSKKLKANITVKHVHSYKIPATCTTPAKCSCGKTFGYALGHNWSTATCTTPAVCSRCHITGAKLDHSYVSGRCRYCGEIDLNYFVDMHITNPGNLVRTVDLYIANGGNEDLRICSGNESPGVGTLYTTVGASARKVGLVDDGGWVRSFTLPSGFYYTGVSFAASTNLVIELDAYLEFDVYYGIKKFRVRVDTNGFTVL